MTLDYHGTILIGSRNPRPTVDISKGKGQPFDSLNQIKTGEKALNTSQAPPTYKEIPRIDNVLTAQGPVLGGMSKHFMPGLAEYWTPSIYLNVLWFSIFEWFVSISPGFEDL